MKNPSSEFDYVKWSFVIGTPLAIVSAITALLSISAVGCATGLNKAVCEAESQETTVVQSKTEIDELSQAESPAEKPQPNAPIETESAEASIKTDEPATMLGMVESAQGFSFQLNSCVQEETAVVCEMLATDDEQSRDLAIHASDFNAKSTIVDESGNQYKANQVVFGDRQTISRTSQVMTQGVGIKAQLIFEDVQLQGDRLALVTVGANFDDGPFNQSKYFSVPFRNVPLSQR